MKTRFSPTLHIALALALLLTLVVGAQAGQAQSGCRYFAATGQNLCGKFLSYWLTNGGLMQQGYPISGNLQEQNPADGKTYTVQYFERAVIESHPVNQPPYDVQLRLLGVSAYRQLDAAAAPVQKANAALDSVTFPQTGKSVSGAFKDYWQARGGLAQFGYPISEQMPQQSQLDGKTYTVQYFERAEMELHPENAAPYNVLLAQLGSFAYQKSYGAAASSANAGCPSPLPQGTWVGTVYGNFIFTGKGVTGGGGNQINVTLMIACDGSFSGQETTAALEVHARKYGQSANCAADVTPIMTFSGKVAQNSSGLNLALTAGQTQQGVIHCVTPIGDVKANIAGRDLLPSVIVVKQLPNGKLGGGEWLTNASYNEEFTQVEQAYGDFASIRYQTTWQLAPQRGGN